MKQHITLEQLRELNNDQFYNLYRLIRPKGLNKIEKIEKIFVSKDFSFNKLLSEITIGKMIEILEKELNWNKAIFTVQLTEDEYVYQFEGDTHDLEIITQSEELCDALWQAVKEIL